MTATGCEVSEADQVRVKAAESFKCRRESIKVVEVEETSPEIAVYEARGCGEVTRYACERTYEQVAAGGERAGGRSNMRSTTHCRAQRSRGDGE